MPYKSEEERRAWGKRWYSKHKDSIKRDVKKRKKLIREWLWERKELSKCEICSEKHPATLDFHHKHGKEFLISHMMPMGYSTKRIQFELDKCQVLCAN